MLSHFEFQGIMMTLQQELESSARKEKRHKENSKLEDQNPTYRDGQGNDAVQQSAYQAGIRFAIEQVRKLDCEHK